MKLLIFFIATLFILPTEVSADDFTVAGFAELGKKSTADDYIEEDEDAEYSYQKYHFKLKHNFSEQFNYDVSSFIYQKDYKVKNSLDSISKTFDFGCSYYPRRTREYFLRLGLDFLYKEKRYDNLPAGEYDRARAEPSLALKEEGSYRLDLAAGADNFDYLARGEKDELKIFGKIGGKKYFFDEDLVLSSSYRVEETEQKKANRKRTKQSVGAGLDYMFDLSWIYKAAVEGGWGERDTKTDEERDEDYDYEYWNYGAKTEHRITPEIATDLKCRFFKKDYLSGDLDHSGFSVKNGWEYQILDDKARRITFEFAGQHKKVDYDLKTGNDYRKETVEAGGVYQKKKDWKGRLFLQSDFYDYSDSANEKKRYYGVLSLEKLFLEGDLILSADFKYRFTDYEQKDDTEQLAARLAFEYGF